MSSTCWWSVAVLPASWRRSLPQNKVYIANPTSDTVACPFGCLVAGFGKGKWEVDNEKTDGQAGDGEENLHVPYNLKDHAEFVIMYSKMTTLLDVVNIRRESVPDVKIAYHDIEPEAAGPPGAFKLTCTNKIKFVPQAKEQDVDKANNKPPAMLQTTAGTMLPLEAWNTETAYVCWSVKWGINGLMPVRPQVVLRMPLELTAGMAVLL